MAGPQHIPLHGSFHCSFGVAVRYLELGDLAAAREAPDIFSLTDWPDDLLRLFWLLWDALERQSVHADLAKVQEISAQRWRGDRTQVEEWQGLARFWQEHGAAEGFRFLIRQVADVVAHAFIRVDELRAAFPSPKEEASTPESPAPVASSYQTGGQEVEPASAPQPAPQPRTRAERIASLLRGDYPAGRPPGLAVLDMEEAFRRRHPEVRFLRSPEQTKPARTFQTALTSLKWTRRRG
jgi:hypothetical protein